MTDEQLQADARARLPALGAHGIKRSYLPPRYSISAPFPKATSTGDILRIAALISTAGYKILSPEQHEVTIRLPLSGEIGEIVAVDKAGDKVSFSIKQAAKGTALSLLWFCSPDYPFASSFAEQKARDRALTGVRPQNVSPVANRVTSSIDTIAYVEQTATGRGYIYIAINASIPGYVKIGRTVRTPDARAAEFSASTGVPTPFLIAYYAPVSDCVTAERQIHQQLATSRVSPNREFFVSPVHEAIEVVSKVAQQFPIVE